MQPAFAGEGSHWILVVSGDMDLAGRLQKRLAEDQALKAHVTWCVTLEQALARVRGARPAAVVAEVPLSSSRILTALRRLAAEAPVVALARPEEDLPLRCLELGALYSLPRTAVGESQVNRCVQLVLERQQLLSALRRAAHEAHVARTQLEEVLERCPEGAQVARSDGRLLYANPAARSRLRLAGPATPDGERCLPITWKGEPALLSFLGASTVRAHLA